MLKWRFSQTGNEGRISVYSDPYPSGVVGRRGGGKLARMYEQGTDSFQTGQNRSGGGGFTHRGFPALHTMEHIGAHISEGFIDRFLSSAQKVAPNGPGARRPKGRSK